jgi:hypothetical protein
MRSGINEESKFRCPYFKRLQSPLSTFSFHTTPTRRTSGTILGTFLTKWCSSPLWVLFHHCSTLILVFKVTLIRRINERSLGNFQHNWCPGKQSTSIVYVLMPSSSCCLHSNHCSSYLFTFSTSQLWTFLQSTYLSQKDERARWTFIGINYLLGCSC